ncbi:hypothetical protein BS50DRAFT_510039, partial [Corynespora cassiicola Philippines]
MNRCHHTQWLHCSTQGGEPALLESDRLRRLIRHIPHPDTQRPSLIVLIGNTGKLRALRALFGLRRVRRCTTKRQVGEIHLHLDPSSAFTGRPILLAESNLPRHNLERTSSTPETCHETTRYPIKRVDGDAQAETGIYTNLLFPFTDVFCFFATDVGGLEQVAHQLATWLRASPLSSISKSTLPSIVIAIDSITIQIEDEDEDKVRRAFLCMLPEEMTRRLLARVSAIDIIPLFPDGTMSTDARYRRLKERLMERSDQVRRNRQNTQILFSATHLAALLRHASAHFAECTNRPFDVIKASRLHNPVPPDLHEHLSNFLQYIKSSDRLIKFAAPMIASTILLDNYPPGAHAFAPTAIFKALYQELMHRVSEGRVIAFDDSNDVLLRSGFTAVIENSINHFFRDSYADNAQSAVDIHKSNLAAFREQWHDIHSTNTCLCCLRRRPQYCLPCRH